MRRPAGHVLLFSLVLFCFIPPCRAQDSANTLCTSVIPGDVVATVSKKATLIDKKLTRTGEKYLNRLQKEEEKLQKMIWQRDTILTGQLFDGMRMAYNGLLRSQPPAQVNRVYNAHLDSLVTAFQFLGNGSTAAKGNTQEALAAFSKLQTRFDQSERIKKFVSARKAFLFASLERFGLVRELKKFEKVAYYYSVQIKEYKTLWEDPERLEKKILQEVSKMPQFREFFQRNSVISSLFSSPNGRVLPASLASLQTRNSLQNVITARVGTSPSALQFVQGNISAAQSQLGELKNKLLQRYGNGAVGNSGSDVSLPEGCKLNLQKTKTFFQRIEYGLNIQSQKARNYFPLTSDIGLSVGYRLNDQGSIGIGASYKLGWGKSWERIRMTHEGIGLRSYFDYKLKGSFYFSGGYEQNYRTAFSSIEQLKDFSAWQTSGLAGFSKKYTVSKKIKSDVKLLWDFLSYRQTPQTPAILFRVGYSLK